MPFRFRKSVRLFPGVRVNLSKSGMSVSVGGPGATLNLSSRGSAVTLGLPGTGLSYRHQLTTKRRPATRTAAPEPEQFPAPEFSPPPVPQYEEPALPLAGEIKSAEVAALTSPDLQGLKQLLNEASHQRADLQHDLAEAQDSRLRAWRKLRRREQLPLRLVMKSAIPKARAAYEEAEVETVKVLEAIAVSEVRIEFAFDGRARAAQEELAAAHGALSRSRMVWDVLSSVAVDRVRERSTASDAVTRTPVHLSTVSDSIIAGEQLGLRFQNANGADLDFFPGFLLVRERNALDYALIDLRDVRLEVAPVSFIETEPVPYDAEVIGQTWAKANRDGSPDRRFKDNYQIPVVRYGSLRFRTPSGIEEAYHVSDAETAERFGRAFEEMQRALRALGQTGPSGPVVPAREAVAIDAAARLPELPDVRPAHEITAGAAAAIGALAFLAYTKSPPAQQPVLAIAQPSPVVRQAPVPEPPPVRSLQAPAPAPAAPQPPPPSSPQAARTAPTQTAPPAAAQTELFDALFGGPKPVPNRERMVLTQNANLRVAPDRSAAAIRVVPISTTVVVFGRSGSWVQVGDSSPWGWMHGSILSAVP